MSRSRTLGLYCTLIILFVISESKYILDESTIECKAHAQFNDCGTSCPRTCRNKDLNLLCTAQCVRGCYCEPGFVLDDDGSCVSEDACPKTCLPHSQYNECGTACPRTCKNKDEHLLCTDQCVPGCYCEPGYVLDDKGVCVAEGACPKTCPLHSQYNGCGTACPRTCENKDEHILCTEQCVPGCYCEPGYVLDDKGVCVTEGTCPKKCPPHSQYNECGAACPRTCKNKDKDFECKKGCKPGCFCEPGYVLENGNCVPEQTCH